MKVLAEVCGCAGCVCLTGQEDKILWRTGNQCSCRRCVSITTRAAIFWALCNLLSDIARAPSSSELQ